MKNTKLNLFFFTIAFATACSTSRNNSVQPEPYNPPDKGLYDTIVQMDSILFQAYNTCDLEKYASLFSEDFEFYHDKGGLETNKKTSVESFRKYVCGKVTRELLKGSIEVTPIANFGAAEIGKHRFHNNQEPNAQSRYARFVIIWKRENGAWKITRVISLH